MSNDDNKTPRQPKDMKGLLNFCLEASAKEDAPTTRTVDGMDPVSRTFLESALNEVAGMDPIQEMRKAMKLIEDKLCSVSSEGSQEVNEIAYIVDEVLLDMVASSDYANDFYKLGGDIILEEMLRSNINTIKIKGCDLLAETVQNNPYAQGVVMESPLVKILTGLLEDEGQIESVRVKALYGVSCLIRDNPKTPQYFDVSQLAILVKTVDSKSIKLRTKTCFLLTSLVASSKEVGLSLVKMGLVQKFVDILKERHDSSHEYVASALRAVLTENEEARKDCQGLRPLLESRMVTFGDDEGHVDEVNIYKDLLAIISH